MKVESPIKKNTLESYHQRGGKSLEKVGRQVKQGLEVVKKEGKRALSKAAEKIDNKVTEQAKSLASKAGILKSVGTNIASNSLTSFIMGSESKEDEKVENEAKEEKLKELHEKKELAKAEALKKVDLKPKKNSIDSPALIFITGFESFSLSTDYDGLREMAESMDNAKVFNWDDKEKILDEISSRKVGQPIVLVGHSFGGDTAMEIVDELNHIKHGFRPVDLLVTLDSVGSNNDIVPQNVKKNINFFGESSWFFNDEPNVARDTDFTTVQNELRSEGHRELDNSEQVQYKILKEIHEILRNGGSA